MSPTTRKLQAVTATGKSEVDVRGFLESNLDQDMLKEFDGEAGLWFLVCETISLSLALFQIEETVWQVNIGFLNFVVSGFLFLIYEYARHKDRADWRFSIFRCLRWYILMLLAALTTVLTWYVVYISYYNYLSPLDLAGQLGTFTPIAFASFLVFWLMTKKKDTGYHERLRSMLVRKEDTTVIEVTMSFAPTGILDLIVLYVFNCAVFLATLNGDPFNVALMQSIINGPLIWGAALLLAPFGAYLSYRFTVAEQTKLIEAFEN